MPGPGQYKIPASFDYINNVTREKGYFGLSMRFIIHNNIKFYLKN